MDRRARLRKIGVIVAGVAVLVAGVLFLRDPQTTSDADKDKPRPVQTSVDKFTADGIIAPEPGGRPQPPGGLGFTSAAHRLVAFWQEPAGAAGYDVSWGHGGKLDQHQLVVEPIIQLDGLDDGTPYDVEVRTVDAFGARSDGVRSSGTPGQQPDPTAYTMVDRFDGAQVPDPTKWRFASPGYCGKATRGDGQETKRLVISATCSTDTVALRARTPLKVLGGTAELARVVVETDAPGEAGALIFDLVPGQVDLVGGSQGGPPLPEMAGSAQNDTSLPPGSIRVRISSVPASRKVPQAAMYAQVLTAPDVPHTGVPVPVQKMPAPRHGVSARWEVVLRTDGLQVLRDGVVVGGGDVVPTWQEATALIGFGSSYGGFRAGIDLIGFVGGQAGPQTTVAGPEVEAERTVQTTTAVLTTAPVGPHVDLVSSGQLRLSLVPQGPLPVPTLDGLLSVDVAGRRIPARPVLAGQPLARGVRYPVIADVPSEALILSGDRKALRVRVSSTLPVTATPPRVEWAELELVPAQGATVAPPDVSADGPLPRPATAVARVNAALLDAGGREVEPGKKAPPGRLVVDVLLDGVGAQRIAGQLAGLAGIEVRLDGKLIAGIPTVQDGPGVAGHYRIAFVAPQNIGRHSIEVRAIGVDGQALFASTSLTFTS